MLFTAFAIGLSSFWLGHAKCQKYKIQMCKYFDMHSKALHLKLNECVCEMMMIVIISNRSISRMDCPFYQYARLRKRNHCNTILNEKKNIE